MHRTRIYSNNEVEQMIKQINTCSDTAVNTMKYAVQKIIEGHKAPNIHKEWLISKGLTEFEAVHLLNNPPRKILDLYVIIEELEERLTENEMIEILSILSPYTRNK